MEFNEFVKRAKTLRDKYAKIESVSGQKSWGALERTQGLVSDVGDLMKLVMAKNGLRKIDDVDAKLAHELSDCLWSILIIADELHINIEKEFEKNMDELEKRLNAN